MNMKTPTIKSYEEIREEVVVNLSGEEYENIQPEELNKRAAKSYASQFVREAAERAKIKSFHEYAGRYPIVDKDSILSLLKVIEND